MDAETERQIRELESLQTAHRDRLQVLLIQEARMGRSAPPEIVTEIADIRTRLVPVDAALFKLTYVGAVRADTPPRGSHADDRHTDGSSIAIERALERHRRTATMERRESELSIGARIDNIVDLVGTLRSWVVFVGLTTFVLALALLALFIVVALRF